MRGVYLVVASPDLSSCRHCPTPQVIPHLHSTSNTLVFTDLLTPLHSEGTAPNTSWERHPTFSQPDPKVRARLRWVGGGWRQSGCGGVPLTRPPSRPPAPPPPPRGALLFSTRPPGWRPRPVAPPAERCSAAGISPKHSELY